MKWLKINDYVAFKEAINYYKNNNISKTQVAQKFGVNRKSIFFDKPELLNNYEYEFEDKIYALDEREKEIIQEYINTSATQQDIRRKYGTKPETLIHYLKIMNLPYDRKYKKEYNRNAFNEIKTEEDAYWLGFITADGYLNEERHFLNIKLGEKDMGHLEKFCHYLNAKPEEFIVKDKGGSNNLVYSVTFNSIELENNLKQYGLQQRKSTKENYYQVQTHLIRHYIRGIFDGDGGFIENNQKNRIDRIQIVGSLNILNSIKEEIEQYVVDVNPINVKQKELYVLLISGYNKIYKVSHWLYEDSNIYLDRKMIQYNRLKLEQQRHGRE